MKNIRIDSEIVNLDKVVRAINLGDAVKLVDESDNEIAYFADPAAQELWQFLEKTCVFEFDTPEPAPSAPLPPRVRVVKGERWNWYHRCIGEEFEAIEFNDGGYVVKDHHKIGNSDIGFILSEDCIPVYPEPEPAAATFHAGDVGYMDNPETPQVDGEGNLLY